MVSMHRDAIVSVIMPVYNAEIHVLEAANSILNQTLQDIELIIVDDGSTDSSWELIQTLKDPRIRLIQQANQGAFAARNQGIRHAVAPYIASMDADDVSAPDRLQSQLDFLRRHSDIGLVGSWHTLFDGHTEIQFRSPTSDFYIKRALPSQNVFAGGSVMVRHELLTRVGCYRAFYSDDYDLWLRISEIARIAIIPRYLYRYRISEYQTTKLVGSKMYTDGLRSVRMAVQRYVFGEDALGYSIPSCEQTSALFHTYQAFVLYALSRRNIRLASQLASASIQRSLTGTVCGLANVEFLIWASRTIGRGMARCTTYRWSRGAELSSKSDLG